MSTLGHKISGKVQPKIAYKTAHLASGVAREGCPLEDNYLWEFLVNEPGVASPLCWAEFGKGIVCQNKPGDPGIQFYRYNKLHGSSAILAAHYYDIPGDGSLVAPFAKCVDVDNCLVAFMSGTEIHIQQKLAGTWSQLASAPLASGDWIVTITTTSIGIKVDGNDILLVAHDIDGEGDFGALAWRWDYDEHLLCDRYIGRILNAAQLPCMTGYNTPYGECAANEEYNVDPYHLAAWKGIDCVAPNAYDCWCTNVPMTDSPPAWLEWKYPGAQPMVPTRFEIKPRVGMNPDWWLTNNPKEISLVGIRIDGTEVEIFRQELNDWNHDGARSWNVTATEAFFGVRLYIHTTNGYNDTGDFHTCIGWWKVWGVEGDPVLPPIEIPWRFADGSLDPVTFKAEYIDTSKKFWVDGVEYDSGATASIPKDEADHTLTIERSDLRGFWMPWHAEIDTDPTDWLDFPNCIDVFEAPNIFADGISGDVTMFDGWTTSKRFAIGYQPWSNGDVSALRNILPTTILQLRDCLINGGDISDWIADVVAVGCQEILLSNNSFTYTMDSLAGFTGTQLYIGGRVGVWYLSGDLALIKDSPNVETFYFEKNGDAPDGAVTMSATDTFLPSATNIYMVDVGLNTASVDNILAAKIADCEAGGPTGGTLNLLGNQGPTSAGAALAERLRNEFGWTVDHESQYIEIPITFGADADGKTITIEVDYEDDSYKWWWDDVEQNSGDELNPPYDTNPHVLRIERVPIRNLRITYTYAAGDFSIFKEIPMISGVFSIYSFDCTGDTSGISHWRPTSINFGGTKVTIDLNDIKDWPINSDASLNNYVIGDLSLVSSTWNPTKIGSNSSNFTGDIAEIAHWPISIYVNCRNTSWTGDISNLANWWNPPSGSTTYLDLGNTGVSGDLASIRHLPIEYSSSRGLSLDGTQVSQMTENDTLCPQLARIELNNCQLDQASVDNVLVAKLNDAVNNGLIDGYLNVDGNAAPTQTGIDAANELINTHGWTVTYTTPLGVEAELTSVNESLIFREGEPRTFQKWHTNSSDDASVVKATRSKFVVKKTRWYKLECRLHAADPIHVAFRIGDKKFDAEWDGAKQAYTLERNIKANEKVELVLRAPAGKQVFDYVIWEIRT